MFRVRVLVLLWFGLISFPAFAGEEGSKLMRFADTWGQQVVFTYEGDLWLVSREGGEARRLTSHEGGESFAKFSPDGTRIAFSASYDGGRDVYVMDLRGGAPKRLTYHPAADFVQEWYPDGKSILFRSIGRAYPSRGFSLWKVDADGGMPERLPIDRGGLATISGDGKAVAYNRIAREFATWKRYMGGMAMNIWICWLDEGRFEQLSSHLGNDNWPMWIGDDIYYASDMDPADPETLTTANIFKTSVSDRTITQVTHHTEYDVKYPSRGGPGDETIIYQNAGELYLLDLDTNESRKIPITIPTDQVPVRESHFEAQDYMRAFGLSSTGVRMVFDSRGDIFTVPVEKGTPRCLTEETPASREKNPAWSPDGKWIAFLSDRSGEEELYLVDQKGEGDWIQLTEGGKGFRMQPVWSPDSKHLAFADKYLQLTVVDVDNRSFKVVDRATVDTGWEDWGIQEYSFSPDSRWLVYTKVVESQLESIFLYSLDEDMVYPVTDPSRNDFSPTFDPDGDYLYFLSDRTFNPIMGDLDQNHLFLNMTRPYVVILKEGKPSPFKQEPCDEALKGNDEEVDEKEAALLEAAADYLDIAAEESVEEAEETDAAPSIDPVGLARRTVVAPVPAGNYFRLTAVKGGFVYLSKQGMTFLKYQVVHDGSAPEYDFHKFDLKSEETANLMSGIGNYHLSADGKKTIYRAGNLFGVVDTGAKASTGDGRIDLSRVYGKVDKQAEFLQAFDEAWRIERDFFYDKNMHGMDWDAVGEKYRKLVKYCGNRSDLNYLIGEMIGELSAGHTYVWGGDMGYQTDAPRPAVGLMGVDFDQDDREAYHRIKAVLPGDNADPQYRSPLYAPDCEVEDGDYLIAVDGKEVKRSDNVYAFFVGKRDALVTITYNSAPSADDASAYSFRPIGSDMELRYRRWVEGRRDMVDAATDGSVAYVHLPDMGQRGLIEFAKVYYSQFYKKGLIIDDRYNGGGFTADMMLDRLERKLWSLTIPREGNILRNPENVFYGPMTLIINEDTGSCGEYFATAFRHKKLGQIVGKRTWGGAVGIEPHQSLVDGGTVTPPQFAPYSPFTGAWQFEGWGVEPDIEVQNMPADVVAGRDAQLEKAIEIVLSEINDYYSDWEELPPPPVYPIKR